MRILYLINHAGQGGSEKYVENLTNYFSQKPGTECFLCYNEPGALSDKLSARGIECIRLEMKSPFDFKAAKKLAGICRDYKIDVVHAQFPRENYIALLSKRFYKKPKVMFTAHLIMRQPKIWHIFNKIMTPKNECVFAVCNASADALRANGVCPEVIKTVYNGIDREKIAVLTDNEKKDLRASLGIPVGNIVISIMARFSPEKGLDFLADSVAKLKAQNVSVVIMGDGEGKESFRMRVSDMGIADKFVLTGYRSDCPRILAVSDIYVCSSSEEAMSYSALEAMAQALPLVMTDVGGNPTLVKEGGECGLLAAYGDSEGFAKAVDTLCENEKLRKRFGGIALEKTKTMFDQNKLLDRIFEIYQN